HSLLLPWACGRYGYQSTAVPSSRTALLACMTSCLNGWRAAARSLTSTPKPTQLGTCQAVPSRLIGVLTTSSYQGTAPDISSWITKFGVETSKCRAAAPAIGPFGL